MQAFSSAQLGIWAPPGLQWSAVQPSHQLGYWGVTEKFLQSLPHLRPLVLPIVSAPSHWRVDTTYSVEGSGENWWLFYFRASVSVMDLPSWFQKLLPRLIICAAETFPGSPTQNKLITLRHLGSKSAADTRLLFWIWNQIVSNGRLAITCFVTKALSDSNRSQKPASKHEHFAKSWPGSLCPLLAPKSERSCGFLFSSEFFSFVHLWILGSLRGFGKLVIF